ncbi:hypothetical protein SO802_017922 [Lithocarpus litseifolius]|uniref:Uncharacterized protein n=1 Tax=Lithocarpus litseifolius TaxID=425828 RepID=A0AAW2CJD7_9ROSI
MWKNYFEIKPSEHDLATLLSLPWISQKSCTLMTLKPSDAILAEEQLKSDMKLSHSLAQQTSLTINNLVLLDLQTNRHQQPSNQPHLNNNQPHLGEYSKKHSQSQRTTLRHLSFDRFLVRDLSDLEAHNPYSPTNDNLWETNILY